MDHRGHPKRPLERESLNLFAIAEAFLVQSEQEEPSLAKSLRTLDEQGKGQLGGVLGRFDLRGHGELDAGQRLLARRVLTKLHKPSTEGLVLLNKILDYLDLNLSAIIELNELELCVEILELFARADSDNDTLSFRELTMLYAVLRFLDRSENGQLDPSERDALRRGLNEPQKFLAEQREHNSWLAEALASLD